jgi:hypothetical protein
MAFRFSFSNSFVPGLIGGTGAGLVWLDCAFAEPIMANSAAAKAAVALRKKRRRL